MRDYAYFGQMGWKTRALNFMRRAFRSEVTGAWLQKRTSGSVRSSFWCRLIPPEYTYPKGSWRLVERNGIKLRLDLSNATDHGAYFDPLDRADEELKRLVRPDSTVIDIGANIGVYALTFAKLASTGRVIAFEPDPDNFNRLQENVALNSPSNLVVKNVGIGATEQVHRLYRVVESNSGMNRIFKDTVLEESFPFSEISVRPLLDALQDTDTARVELIKVDVEGFELEVLRGCERIIDRDHPDLFIELDDGNLKENGTSAKELVGFLLAKGYLLFDAATGAALNTSDNLESCATDIICSVKPNS